MRFISIVLIILGFLTPISQKTSVTILPGSSITIKGSSNVSSFECEYNTQWLNGTIACTTKGNPTECEVQGAKIQLKNKGFDCGSSLMNKDFLKLVKANEYPTLNAEVKKIKLANNQYLCQTCIEVAGVKRNYDITINHPVKNHYTGTLTINIKDFNLSPPTKMLGMVVMREKITVFFNIFLEVENI